MRLHREWDGDLKKLPNIKMRKLSARGLTQGGEQHKVTEEREDGALQEDDNEQPVSDVDFEEDEDL